MNRTKTARFAATFAALAVTALFAEPLLAQNVTTGTISGSISDQQGGALPGATVTAVHEPTGTRYEALTGGDGRYQMPSVRVGEPYRVTATLSGFRDKTESNVKVGLGEDRTVDLKLRSNGERSQALLDAAVDAAVELHAQAP